MDNALDKLFEEIREAKREADAASAERDTLQAAAMANNARMRDAADRRDLLDRTLKKHIHEGMPVVQAKMVAHEETSATASRITGEQTARSYADNALSQRVISATFGPRITI